jgi:tRNA pseudouridine(55) synthase
MQLTIKRLVSDGLVVICDKRQATTSRVASSRVLQELAGSSPDEQPQSKRARPLMPKLGHVGTLDPMATGTLPVLVGPATRLANYLPVDRKRYTAIVRLGVETDSGDADGKVTKVDAQFTRLPEHFDLAPILAKFLGKISQVPSSYSAIKIGGRPAYELARSGEQVVVPPRTVEVFAISGGVVDANTLKLDVTCGTGTYIRSIGTDVAAACGTVGHLVALRRVSSGPFGVPEQQSDAFILRTYSLLEALCTFCQPVEIGANPELEKHLRCGRGGLLFQALLPLLPPRAGDGGEDAAKSEGGECSKYALTVSGKPRALVQADFGKQKIDSLVQFQLQEEEGEEGAVSAEAAAPSAAGQAAE